MSVEARPFNVACNLSCTYCYQEPQRQAGNVVTAYNFRAMKRRLLEIGQPFALFGGEATLLPIAELERFLSLSHRRFRTSSIQTNGTALSSEHIALFKKYNTSVGISLDGPGELNDPRWAGTLERTRALTEASNTILRRMLEEGLSSGLIFTLHRANASPARLPRLVDWLRELRECGLKFARAHLLEVESDEMRRELALTTDENVSALRALAELRETGLDLDLFSDMRQLLLGRDQRVACTWSSCDPYSTAAVMGVEAEGELSNCGRASKNGIDYLKSRVAGYERQLALYATPQSAGGCAECRFFLMCKGQCPGTAINGDWRNRSEHCEVYKVIFEDLEVELVQNGDEPISLNVQVRQFLEEQMLRLWSQGRNTSLQALIERTLQSTLAEADDE